MSLPRKSQHSTIVRPLYILKQPKRTCQHTCHQKSCAACFYWNEQIAKYRRKMKKHLKPTPFVANRKRRVDTMRSSQGMSEGIPVNLRVSMRPAKISKIKRQLQPSISQITLPSNQSDEVLRRQKKKIKQRAAKNQMQSVQIMKNKLRRCSSKKRTKLEFGDVVAS